MAIGVTRVADTDAPERIGREGLISFSLTGDGSATTVTVTADGLSQVNSYLTGVSATGVIDNTLSPPTIALTLAAALGSSALAYIWIKGEGR